MARRQTFALGCFLIASTAMGAGYGCAAITGIPAEQRLRGFFENTIRPLWKYGPNAPTPEPETLDWIKPEKGAAKGR